MFSLFPVRPERGEDEYIYSEVLSLLEGIKDETVKRILLAQIKAASAL